MIFVRGNTWWFEFNFLGQRIKDTTHIRVTDGARKKLEAGGKAGKGKTLTTDEKRAMQVERERRHRLENGVNQVKEMSRPALFTAAAAAHLEMNEPHWSKSNAQIESYNVGHLRPHFGGLLLNEITGDDVTRYQVARKKENANPRTINMEVATLRAILRKHRLWANIQPDVRMLKTTSDIGRAVSDDELHRLLVAANKSRSRSLYPALLVSFHTGLRNKELRMLRWRQIDLMGGGEFPDGSLTVGVSKTVGGEGRVIPLSRAAQECLKNWRRQFPAAEPDHFVFCRERYGLDGEKGYLTGKAIPYEIKPHIPIGSWKVSWTAARAEAKVSIRWHDSRHYFISKLAEAGASDATIMALAGHVSRKMMERYSHVRNEAKQRAMSAFNQPLVVAGKTVASAEGSPQNHPQTPEVRFAN